VVFLPTFLLFLLNFPSFNSFLFAHVFRIGDANFRLEVLIYLPPSGV
jgi:hypothetical protein